VATGCRSPLRSSIGAGHVEGTDRVVTPTKNGSRTGHSRRAAHRDAARKPRIGREVWCRRPTELRSSISQTSSSTPSASVEVVEARASAGRRARRLRPGGHSPSARAGGRRPDEFAAAASSRLREGERHPRRDTNQRFARQARARVPSTARSTGCRRTAVCAVAAGGVLALCRLRQ